MPILLLDTCVITDLADEGSAFFEWSVSTLEGLDGTHKFVINPIVYAEFSVGYETIEGAEKMIKDLDLEMAQIPREALFLAGKAFLQYRRNSGTKVNVLPDFFIGAHAAVMGCKLMARDKGRFATYFPTVERIEPSVDQ